MSTAIQPSTGKSQTAPQVLILPVDDIRPNIGTLPISGQSSGWYATVRAMRKDPTISMVRQLVIAPVIAAPWNFVAKEGAPKEAAEFIRKQLEEIRTYLIRTTMFGCIDFGYQAFEKVFDYEDGKIVLRKMKAFIPDYLDILVNVETGSYAGLRDWNTNQGWYVDLPPEKTFVHAFDVEGTYWYGKGYMENAEDAYNQWTTSNDANVRYDTKIAGSHWVIHYPMGVSVVNGTEKSNETIAQEVLAALQSSGGIAVPKKVEEFLTELDKETPNSWEIELISDKGATQVAFLDRMGYLDKLKVRALGLPERSILEGKYGTKAEAETHADFAITNIMVRGEDLARDLNWYIVDPLLEINYGKEAVGTVRVVPDAIGSDVKRFLRDVYMKLIGDSRGFLSEVAKLDRKALRETLSVPSIAGEEDDEFFQEELDRLKEGPENGVLNQNGLGDPLRQQQRGEVGRPEQFRSGDGNNSSGRLGDLVGRRENQ